MQNTSKMAPSAVLSKLRGNRYGSYSSSIQPSDHTSLPPLQTPAQSSTLDGPSSPPGNKNPVPRTRISSFSESPTGDLQASRMTALPRFSDEWHQGRPSSATSERPRSNANGTLSSVASRAHNLVFSLQPPRRFTASLPPSDSPVASPNTGSPQFYGDRPNLKNVSTSSLSVAEDAVSHKGGSSRLGKGKFNLLNPLSLLARRRSSQNQLPKTEQGNLSVNTLTVPNLPDNYDPRIRGKIVHDFSIPKAKRLNSYTGLSSAETSPSIDSRPSTQSNPRPSEQLPPFASLTGRPPQSPAQSPLFKEQFSDDRQALQLQAAGNLYTLTNFPWIKTASDPPRLPAFAKSLPLDIFGEEGSEEKNTTPAAVDSNVSSGKLTVVSKSLPSTLPPSNSSQLQAQSSVSLSPPDQHPSPTPDFLRPNESLPKHMTSTSSRFSFQLSGIDSEAQERLLEEKHKQHVASKISTADNGGDNDSEEDQYADDDFEDDDGLEEKIPGVNADLDEEVEGDLQQKSPEPFPFTPLSVELRPNPQITASQLTPRDGEGQVIRLANTKVPANPGQAQPCLEVNTKVLEQLPWLGGLGITSLGGPGSPGWTGIVQQLAPQPENSQEEADDLYFDDGNFEGLDDVSDGGSFDENMLDDEFSNIHDIPAENARRLKLAQEENLGRSSKPGSFPQWTTNVVIDEACQQPFVTSSTDSDTLKDGTSLGKHHEVDGSPQAQRSGLTEDNLAYQNALVSAANTAVAQGRFSRHLSMSQNSEDLNSKSQIAESQPGLISDDSRISRFLDNAAAEDEPDDFPFDDSLEDDPMIAEANAEVLENDDDGFYGQEFGFYARASGKGNSEMINGGYFGPRGVEGVHRSHSAKANFQEPSLTPITERSEWSHRNSVASLQTLGLPQSAQAIASPGIAQLLDLDPATFEDEMSLNALMKLRRGAWGGSQSSLNSTGSSHAGSSPLAQLTLRDGLGSQLGGLENGPLTANDFPRHSYDFSAVLPEVFEEERTRQSSNTTETQSTPRKKLSDAGPQQTVLDHPLQSKRLSQTSQAAEKAAQGHSRASSGAESVSYIKDPEGSGRWLLERRRTGDDGELELVGREYVAGARI